MDKETLTDHVSGCLLGAAIGDAIGRPTEGMTPYQVIKKFNFVDGFFKIDGQVGQYSNETKMALLLCGTMAKNSGVAPEFFASFNEAAKAKFNIVGAGAPGLLMKAIPMGIYSALTELPDRNIAALCKANAQTHSHKHETLSAYMIIRLIKECIKNHGTLRRPFDLFDSEQSLLVRLYRECVEIEMKWKDVSYEDSVSDRLNFVRSKLMHGFSPATFAGISGTSSSHFEALALAVFCFMNEPDEFRTVYKVASLGGSSVINAGLTGALIGAYLGGSFLYDIKEDVADYSKIQTLASGLVDALWREPAEERDPTEEQSEGAGK